MSANLLQKEFANLDYIKRVESIPDEHAQKFLKLLVELENFVGNDRKNLMSQMRGSSVINMSAYKVAPESIKQK